MHCDFNHFDRSSSWQVAHFQHLVKAVADENFSEHGKSSLSEAK